MAPFAKSLPLSGRPDSIYRVGGRSRSRREDCLNQPLSTAAWNESVRLRRVHLRETLDVRFDTRRTPCRAPPGPHADVHRGDVDHSGAGNRRNTAIFSIVNSALLKPLPFPEPDRLVGLWQTAPGVNITDLSASIADYVTYREESRTLADVAIWKSNALTVTGLAEPERVDGISATFRLLPMLGVQPILGRAFAERDDEAGSPEVVMLGHGYWQRRFGGDPGVVGRRIMVDGTAREIIGVLPEGFWFMDVPHDLVLPLRFERAKVRLAGYNFRAIGRLRPGVSIEAAERGRRAHDRHRDGQVSAARRHEREDDGGRAARPERPPAD